jgi:muramoyltetrapeptide carboxypeptidase
MHTLGTPWELDLDKAIFVFEEVGGSPHTIDRALLQLTQAGKLETLQGVIVGHLVDCEWDEGVGSPWPHTKVLEEVLKDRLAGSVRASTQPGKIAGEKTVSPPKLVA